MDKTTIRVLLAFDGSELAMEAARYIAAVMPVRQTEVVLFYVERDVSQSFWQVEKQLDFRFQSNGLRAQMASSHRRINDALKQACAILTEAGFEEEAVAVKIKDNNRGIVNDIIREAQNGYDAIVLGRTGTSKIKDALLGTVPAKLLKRIQTIPIIIVDGQGGRNRRMLVAFDGSKEVMRAVQSLSFLIGAADCKVCLCHVLPPQSSSMQAGSDATGLQSELHCIEPKLNRSKQSLFEAGLSFNQIGCELIPESVSCSNTILTKAEVEDYGTVVVGRRGLTALEKIFSSRVGGKIFLQARGITVWVMG